MGIGDKFFVSLGRLMHTSVQLPNGVILMHSRFGLREAFS